MEHSVRVHINIAAFATLAILLGSLSAFALPTLKEEWVYDVSGITERGFKWSTPILVDLDGDGTLETVIGTEKGNRLVAVSSEGQLVWVFPPMEEDADKRLNKAHAAADIDNDGKVEVLFSAGASFGTLYCLNGADGTLKWNWTDPEANFKYGGTIIRDVTGPTQEPDGIPEIVTVGADAKVYVFSNTGELLWYKFLPPGRSCDSVPQAFDVDQDGKVEVMVFSRSQGEGPGEGLTGVFYVLGPTGNEEWSWRSGLWCDWLHNMPTVADINDDGEYEIIFGLWRLDSTETGGIVIINFYGVELARKPVTKQVAHDAMVWDIDGDGKKEILIGSREHVYYCLNPDLSEKWRFNYTTIMGPVSKPLNMNGALGDVTGDGKINVVFQTWQNSTVFILDEKGQMAAEPYNLVDDATTGVVIGDIDKDGKSEIVAASGTKLYCLTLDALYDASTFVWPMLGRNPMHTGAVPIPEVVIAVLPLLVLPFLRRR